MKAPIVQREYKNYRMLYYLTSFIPMLKTAYSFKGRIGVREYRNSFLIYMVVIILIEFLTWWERTNIAPEVAFILYIPFAWFFIAQGAKRCHDRNNTGFYQIIPLYVLFMCLADGTKGANDFGDDPKERRSLNYFYQLSREPFHPFH